VLDPVQHILQVSSWQELANIPREYKKWNLYNLLSDEISRADLADILPCEDSHLLKRKQEMDGDHVLTWDQQADSGAPDRSRSMQNWPSHLFKLRRQGCRLVSEHVRVSESASLQVHDFLQA
jgi:hypothetical protein